MPRCCALALAGVLLLTGCASAPGTAVWSGTRVDDAELSALLLTAAQVRETTGVELPDETVADAAPTGVAHSVLYTPAGSGLQVHQALVDGGHRSRC